MIRYKRMRGILIVFLLVALVVLLILSGTDMFGIHKITVLGNQKLEYNDIIKLSGIIPGQNIFKLDIDKIKENLHSNPYIQVNKIERNFPNTVTIHMKERKPLATIEYLNSFIVIDREGYILEIGKELGNARYPIVTGIKVTAFQVGQKIQSSDSYQIKVIDHILGAIYVQQTESMISEINVENPNNAYFITREGIKVVIGQAENLDNKILWMRQIIPELQKEGKTKGILDVTAGSNASYRPYQNE